MKQNINPNAAAMQAAINDIKEFYNGSFSELPKRPREPKGKILSFNWEPIHETYAMPNIQGAA